MEETFFSPSISFTKQIKKKLSVVCFLFSLLKSLHPQSCQSISSLSQCLLLLMAFPPMWLLLVQLFKQSATAVCVLLLITEVSYTLCSQSWKPVASIFFSVVFPQSTNCINPFKLKILLLFVHGVKFYTFLPGK